MSRPTFAQGVFVAAIFALAASVAATALAPASIIFGVSQSIVIAIALAYLLYLLHVSGERLGRVTVLSVWSAMVIGLWLFDASFSLVLLAQLGAMWLVRSLYFYSSALSAFCDLGLNFCAVAVAYWAAVHTGSVLLSVWCFFLVQALFVAIPRAARCPSDYSHNASADTEEFECARLRAEQALRQLFPQ